MTCVVTASCTHFSLGDACCQVLLFFSFSLWRKYGERKGGGGVSEVSGGVKRKGHGVETVGRGSGLGGQGKGVGLGVGLRREGMEIGNINRADNT